MSPPVFVVNETGRPGAPAVFLDRDGTLMKDVDYCGDPSEVEVFPSAAHALTRLKAAGFRLIVITNQSGIGRGFFDERQYRSVEAELYRQLGAGLIDASYHCPHHPDENCACRKPSPNLVQQAADEHQLDLTGSFFVGDKLSDIECGRRAGVRTVLVRTGYGKTADPGRSDYVASDLGVAADLILAASSSHPAPAPEKK